MTALAFVCGWLLGAAMAFDCLALAWVAGAVMRAAMELRDGEERRQAV